MNNPSVDKEILKNELDKYLQKMTKKRKQQLRLQK